MKTDTLKKSLLDYAIKGSLTAKFRRENAGLNAFDELEIYNEAIKQKRKNLEKELKKCEKEFKLEKDKDKKAFFKSQIQILKKELTKCKEITPLNSTEAPFTIPNSWAWVKLGDICEIISGTSYSKDDLSDEGIRILRGGNINKNTQNLDLLSNDVIVKEKLLNEEKSIQQGDIIITGTNDISNIAKCAFANAHLKNTQIGAFLRIIRIAKEQNAKYIFYIVASGFYEKYIQSCVSGTVSSLLNIKNEYIENFLIPLPPLYEQQEIVKKLDLLVTLANDFAITKENLKRIEKRIEKSLLKLTLEGSLSKLYRRSSPTLCAFNEISTYNEAIKEKRKNLEKELKKCEKEFKLEKDKEQKALFKSQIQMLKKEIVKCKEITPLFCQSHEVQPLKASSGVWGVKGGIRGATSHADEVKPVIRKFKPPCPPLKEKTNNTESTHNEAGESEAPFEIPNSWAWVKLGDICEIVRGGSPRPIEKYLTDSINGFNWIKISDSDIGGKYIKSTKQKIIREGLSQTRFVTSGSLLLTNSMSFGRPYILNVDGCIHDGWLVLSGFETLAKIDYLYFMLSSNYISKCFHQSAAGGVVKNLTTDKVKEQFIPLPPLCEQEHIVQTLDTLFTLKKGLKVE
ncbi:restriction endonuclease subunit S [uncultured Helicobacter sp.]|uniref:restriction endonuclease subunit S n=1 Tax=uncultured Helicobacter sp. TaxID=175537 RepID=UPI0027DAD9E2|nr:restriction endonuclease subunit S [uncultured Helicobacter sp.]